MTAQEIIAKFDLQKHPEGGSFCETYRSHEKIKFSQFEGERNFSTAIYFLLQKNEKSHLHRIKSDEIWHFYQGDPLEVIEINSHGDIKRTRLGSDLNNSLPQYTVKAGHWFASHSLGEFSFVGCTVSPGFDFRDFELGSYQELSSIYPKHDDLIKNFSLKE